VVAVGLAIALRTGAAEPQIRATGMVLQLLGIGTVAYGIRDTRRCFNRDSSVAFVVKWLARFPRWRHGVVLVSGTGAMLTTGFSARAHVWSNVDSNASLQDQLNAVKANVDRVNARLGDLQGEFDTEIRKQTDAIRKEQSARENAVRDLNEQAEKAHTGGLHISAVGVLWLFVGVTLASLSPEIARWRS
jgi:hypothetical protein